MIYLYPANKMENLLALVEKIQQISPLPVFSKEVFIVQNAGMQHWLNMSLAENRGISLNIDYALPAQFLWGLVRTLVNKGDEVDQAPFSREAMSWRIFQLLAEKRIINDDDFTSVTQYWRLPQKPHINSQAEFTPSSQENLKRFQLSCQLADLFEQYLVFRPEWIDAWRNEKSSQQDTFDGNNDFYHLEQWQAKLWLLLVEEQDYNPLVLLKQAEENLTQCLHLIPKRICLFGINAMAPMWLSFINAISEVTEVHFFHLNPCVDYWGDILSEKQAIKHCDKWTEDQSDNIASVGNPLLANLGQQGREFLLLLQEYSTVNIEAFEKTTPQCQSLPVSVLAKIQNDILTLSDAREAPVVLKDESIVITSAHSALREVQGLHDWLLHQFNNDATLTPKDVLVMCPQVEMYAPYVNAVFAKGWQELASDIPPLPCSISDRVAKDSEPLVAAFAELLTLPDSRFQVSQILAWLRLPAMQAKFSLQIEDIEKCTLWIEHACIHWGLDDAHKQQVLGTEKAVEQFSWQYGLTRLLQGFAYADHEAVYEGKLVLPNVEGSDGILLGQLMLVIEQLQYFTYQLNAKRTPQDWHQFLLSFIDDIFDAQQDDNFNVIYAAIETFVEYCQHANFDEKVDLAILREFLNSHFSQPDTGRQFMIGQVTFCSMLPMRSIPFKVVAILGLNDGEYPRQRPPLGFDLMALSASRVGDRSRRGDDRYLFLEAIISARQALYLSYQGRSIKNNNVRQPSIVLKELMDYLEKGYCWKLFADKAIDLRQLAMQPYSEKNYLGQYAGFDKKWLALSPTRQVDNKETNSVLKINNIDKTVTQTDCDYELSVQVLIRFFVHPARFFAQNTLSLYLDNEDDSLNDIEPFDSDHLSRYLLKEQALHNLLTEHNLVSLADEIDETEQKQRQQTLLEKYKQRASLSGKFPQLPHQGEQLDKLLTDSLNFAQFIEENCLAERQLFNLTITHQVILDNTEPSQVYSFKLNAEIQVCDDKIIHFRSSRPKMKDFLGLYLNLLIVEVWLENNSEQNSSLNGEDIALLTSLQKVKASHGFYFDSKNQKSEQFYYPFIDNPKQQLSQLLSVYLEGQSQALLLNSDLAQVFFKAKIFEQTHFETFWLDDHNQPAFGCDPYIQFFWPKCPDFNDIQPILLDVYQNIDINKQQVKK
ncbi:exodeoxyribonuclease V subunit gamma [Colwellia sp. 1_MG-2023]|uniref:exodeoxyribonuclease V subunit gamma n=1 Tax=Colwellia sp. 1_MG-2023 TaxID=3062649 RepID=UPI0026E140FB|nr:exodeoxyribonuclease V subunit gamma [Colwellia sp. 1_MG-2023]MDO6447295.1 exodeoxyribonuclease V subunit gamma [Colwellia sp. 1_MG-2023]